MRCLTVQNKKVLEHIINNGYYFLDANLSNNSYLLKPYEFLKNKYGYKHNPIFLSPVGFHVEMFGTHFSADSVVLELEIPEKYLQVQEYYDWTDYIFFSNNPSEFIDDKFKTVDEFGNYILSQRFQNLEKENSIFQLTTEVLKKEWLLGYAYNLSEISYMHNGSGGLFVLQPLSKYLKQGEYYEIQQIS